MVVGVQQVIPESVPIESFTKLLRPAERRGSKVHTHTYTNIQIAAIIVVHRPTVSTVFYAHSLGFIINVIKCLLSAVFFCTNINMIMLSVFVVIAVLIMYIHLYFQRRSAIDNIQLLARSAAHD